MTLEQPYSTMPAASMSSPWRFLWAFLVGLLATAIFFRSVLPRLPRILFRGKLRIRRVGIRGVRGIEYRSKGFHNDSAAFSRHEDQLELKIQRIYASYHLPYFLCKAKDQPTVVPRKSSAIITIHVQGVGVRLPRSSPHQKHPRKAHPSPPPPHHDHNAQGPSASDNGPNACLSLEQQEELRLQRLMSSPSMSPTSEAPALLHPFPSRTQSPRAAPADLGARNDHLRPPAPASDAGFYGTFHRAGIMSLHSILGLASWIRTAAIPRFRSLVLRAFRAALYLLTSSIPVLTSLVSIEVDRIELYIQEAETVARIGRAGLTFSMSPGSSFRTDAAKQAPNEDDASADRASPRSFAPSWRSFFDAMRMMPTRVGSGARGAASYLVAGISPSTVKAHLRLDGIELFEANFKPPGRSDPNSGMSSRHNSDAAAPNSPARATSPSQADSGPFSPSQSDTAMDTTQEDPPYIVDDSFDSGYRPKGPSRRRSNSASRLSRMSSTTLRGFADRWADWALEPLAESDFHADSGWTRRRLQEDNLSHHLRSIPSSARILSINGVTELTASMLVGSNLALGGDNTLAAKLTLGAVVLRLDAAHRVVRVLGHRKSHTSESAPAPSYVPKAPRPPPARLPGPPHASPASTALRMVSSMSLSLPSVRVMLSSDTVLLAAAPRAQGASEVPNKDSSPRARQFAVSLAGFSFELKHSDPKDAVHRRWIGTSGLAKKVAGGRQSRTKRQGASDTPSERKRQAASPLASMAIDHRRVFMADISLASFEVHCRDHTRGQASRLLFIGDLSVESRSSWTPFGLLASCPESARLLLSGDPNEHVTAVETSVGGVETNATLDDIAALIALSHEVRRRRQGVHRASGANSSRRSKADGKFIPRLPRIAAGLHIKRISLVLDASRSSAMEQHQPLFSKEKAPGSRQLVLSVPNIDFMLFGEYRDEYLKRPLAEKRAAYKALKNDSLEWPISGKEVCKAAARATTRRKPANLEPASTKTTSGAAGENQASTQLVSEPIQLLNEEKEQDQDLQQNTTRAERPPATARRTSMRDAMSKTGKVRLPGYTRRSSMAAETRFNLRYQFETCLAIDAVELFLSLGSEAGSAKDRFARPTSAQSSASRGSLQHHLLAMHSFEMHGSGRLPGNAEPRGSALCDERISLSASDAVAEFRANIEDIDIEAWQPRALDAYTDIAAIIVRAQQECAAANQDVRNGDNASDTEHESSKTAHEPKSLVERLPGGLALYVSIGRTIAHLGGPDHRIEDDVARGVGFEAERIVLEYAAVTESKTNASTQRTNWGARTALELSEDLQLQGVSLATRHGRVGLVRVVLHEAGIFPILDASLATEQHTEGSASETFARAKAGPDEPANKQPDGETLNRPATSLLAEGVWTFNEGDERVHKSTQHRPRFRQQDRSNFIVFVPYAAVKAVVRPPNAVNKAGLAGTSEDEVFITTENTNLLAFRIDLLHTYCILLTLATFKNLAQKAKGWDAKQGRKTGDARAATQRRHPSISCRFDVKEVHTFVSLPRSVRIFIRVRRLEVRFNPQDGLSVSTETIMGAVESPKLIRSEAWEEAVRLRDWKVLLPPKSAEGKLKIQVNGDAALIRVPYGYALNPIIDNTSVAIKATKQIVHQFLMGGDDSIITPYAEDPKMLPDIDINIRVLTIEAQDDPFETKLNLIWRAGLAENLARDEREYAFAAKAEELGASKPLHSATSFRSGRSNVSLGSSVGSVDSDLEDDSSCTSHGTRFTASKKQHVSYEEARGALDAFNSSSWVRRYTNARSEQIRRQEAVLKNIYGRYALPRIHDELPINVLPIGKAAPLVRSTMYRLSLKVGRAQFPSDHLRDFIHEKGAGMPKDTPFSLLVPMHLKWEMEEWRVTLRDYPMPMLHVPPTHRSENDARKAWCFEGDVVLAEQLGGPESIRHVPAVIVPAATGRPDAIEYGIVIPKVAMPVKMYGTPTVRLRTPFPTRLVWGQSIQPTIQDVMRVIDGITPPPHDPSPKLGFWDKLPLILHGHINVKFEDEGGFNIHLKGGRDPYSIEGSDAGWVKSWKGAVEIRIGYDNPQKEVFQIMSHEYVLAVPDLNDYVDHAATGVLGGSDQADRQHSPREGEDSYHDSYDRKSVNVSFTSSMHRYMKDPTFRKIVIKLTNGVRWGSGLHGERTCDDETCPRRPKCKGEPFYRECRNFERIDHWKVITKTREHFDSLPEAERRDSFRGWRSHHLHFSLSVYSPKNGIAGYGGKQTDSRIDTVNNFYFTPLAWAHFWAWMRLFNSAMSLPIRTGQLFPESPPPSPKFGRFIGTIKYRIDLEPLFITHQYRQFNKEDWVRGLRTHVGVKARVNAFTLDMHQRQQETVKERPEVGEPRIVFHKPFYEAEVSCEAIDLKTFAAQMQDDCESAPVMDEHEVGESMFDDLFAQDMPISDDELDWIDMNDLVELDSQTIKDPSPKIRMFPAMICPQFNYYRKVESKRERRAREMQDHANSSKSRGERGSDLEQLLSKLERSKFGSEKSHVCMVGQNDKPYGIQRKLAQDRLGEIRSEIDRVLATGDDASSGSEGHSEGAEDQQERLNELHGRERILSGFISHLGRLQEHADRVERAKAEGVPAPKRSATIDRNIALNATDLASLYHDLGMFDNRFVAHNPTLFFSNVTRTLLLKYYYSSRLRRGYAHHMTATAVRYIRDLLKKKDQAGRQSAAAKMHDYLDAGRQSHQLTPSTEGHSGLDILHEMLDDMVNHMLGKNGYSKSGWGTRSEDEAEADGMEVGMSPTDGISDDFNVVKSNVCLLLKPQIVLRSDVDDNSTVIVTALRTRLQNYTVLDESCADDSVNAIVLRRNFFALDSLQCFHPNARSKSTFLRGARAEKHGFVSLPLETLVDMHGQCRDFERIVPHTNASMYYDKFNKLRLSDSSRSVSTFRKDGKPVQDHLHHHMDMILLNCPRFSVSANSEHFAALYNVVTDLILYRDPAHRDQAKRLEEMMFSYDFTDVSGLADIVTALQLRIREAQGLIGQYRAVSDKLNERGRAEYVTVLGETLELITELNLIMEAITTSQDSKGGADREKKSALRFMTQAQEVAWNMLGDEAGELVAKLALRGISFSWLNKADNSAANTLAIQDLQALSVDPNAMFAEIIAKYLRAPDHPMAKEGRFLDAMWSVLPPVGGISIVDMFEFNLHPVKIQIELVVGRKIMDYIFGTKRQRERQEEEQKRIEDQVRRQEKATAKKKSPLARLLGGRKHLAPSSASSRPPSTKDSSRNASTADLASRSASSSDLLSVGRPSSDGSREDDADSISGRGRGAKVGSSMTTAKNSLKSRPGTPASGKQDAGSDDERRGDQFAIAQRNAAEMRSRASAYRTFVYVKISQTIFCLSYKGEKEKSITDLYDLVFRTPNFEYHNSTFGYVDLADNFKKDVFKAAWNQKSTLLRDIITHRPNRKRNAIESIRAIRQASRARESLAPLDISVEPPTPAERSSFDGSSHLVESPTDTFSYRGTEAYGDDEEESIDSQALEADDGDGSGSMDGRPVHVRQGTGQTLAGRIRDEWGRSNELEAAAAHDSSTSLASSDERRDSVGEVDAMLYQHATPQRETAEPEHGRKFPGLRRLSFGADSPATERGEAVSTASAGSSPYLQVPPGVASRRESLASNRSHSPSFKLNMLLPRSLRNRASPSAGARNASSPTEEAEQLPGRTTSSDYSGSIRSAH